MLEKKLHEELQRFRAINKYADKLIMEQETPPPPGDVPPPIGDVPPPAGDVPPPVGDVPPPAGDVAPISDNTEEIDITDLVNMTKNIKKDIDNNKAEHGDVLAKMDDVFGKLNDLESKLAQMDTLFSKIDQLGSKVDSMKEPTPEEKLEMRSLDSYPFNQNPQQFFAQKQSQMRQSGKNEYVLTKDEISNYSKDNIKTSFNPDENEDEFKF